MKATPMLHFGYMPLLLPEHLSLIRPQKCMRLLLPFYLVFKLIIRSAPIPITLAVIVTKITKLENMNKLITNRNLTIINFGIVFYFILIYFINFYKIIGYERIIKRIK